MAERIARRRQSERSPSDTDGSDGTEAPTATGGKIKADLDDLLDEIDDVLETNAEEFVRSYVQKGGE